MKSIIEQEDKVRFNELLDDFLELEDQKKAISESEKAIKDEMAVILSEPKALVNKVISYLKKIKEGEDTDLDIIAALVEDLE